jgi:hypothetical protein
MTDVNVMRTNVQADDFLQHFGVKGMKWGKHTAESGSSGGGSGGSKSDKAVADKAGKLVNKMQTTKPTKEKVTTQQIKDARLRDEARFNDLASKTSALNLATAVGKGEKAAAKAWMDAADVYTNSPDSATAAKMTKGEKVSTALWATVGVVSAAYLIGSAAR